MVRGRGAEAEAGGQRGRRAEAEGQKLRCRGQKQKGIRAETEAEGQRIVANWPEAEAGGAEKTCLDRGAERQRQR